MPDALYLASGIFQSYVTHNSSFVLQVLGLKMATIESISKAIPSDPDEAFIALRNMVRGTPSSDAYLTGASAQSALVSTLAMDYTKDVVAFSPAMPTVYDLQGAFLDEVAIDTASNDVVRGHILQYIIPYLKGVHNIKTAEGHFGLSNPGIQKGMLWKTF